MASFLEKFAGRFGALSTMTRFVVHGRPSAAAREALVPFQPVYMAPLGGFRR